jgi:hypothetical protein
MADKALQEDRLYLQTHGFRCRPVELNAALVKVIDTMPQTLYGESARELTTAEAEVARSGGLVLEEQDGADPLAQMAAEYAAILNSSLTTKEAAKRLQLYVTRIRQMLKNGSLYGICLDGLWHIPVFQFEKSAPRLIPNITRVNAALDLEDHPVGVLRWYTTPDPDLVVNDKPVSPLTWLRLGKPVRGLVELAGEL